MKGNWALLLVVAIAGSLPAQVFDRPIALPPAEIELLDAVSSAHLENAKRLLTERQWSEAVEAIRRVQETDPSRLARVELSRHLPGFERYVTAGEYCQWRLAALASEAPEALAHYRSLVDALAERWLREGAKNNDERLLRRVVERAFSSSAGDEALLKLGDLALAKGDYCEARGAWQRMGPQFTVSPDLAAQIGAVAGAPLGLALQKFDFSAHGEELLPALRSNRAVGLGIYPDSNIEPAGVLARLALASIFEGSQERARAELSILRLLYSEATGQIAGRDGRYAELMQGILEQSADWSAKKQTADWPTFAGNTLRGKVVQTEIDAGLKPLWSYPLPRLSADRELIGAGRLRVAEDAKSLVSYYPIVVGQTVVLRLDSQASSRVIALDLKTGQRVWQDEQSRGISTAAIDEAEASRLLEVSDAHATLARHIGVARFTATAEGHKLFCRMGSPVTAPSSRRAALWRAKEQGCLMGFDLATQGKPLEGFPIRPPGSEWTFEGTPISDGGAIYAAMRRVEGSRSQIYLAAFELQTTPLAQPEDRDENARPTGRLKWRTRICSSSTLGSGDVDEITHLLVTKDHGRLYLNTSAGAVAAVRANDGQLLWLVKYPRVSAATRNPDQREKHLFRDLTPCVAWKDLVIVAPADCDRIFALYAANGELAWTLPPGMADDAVHLLGVADDTLVAGGDSLYWVDALEGRLLAQFPRGRLGGEEQAAPSPRGFGRGILVDGHVWWPTRETLFVFTARPAETDFGWQARLVREIPLAAPKMTGGNLVMAGGVLLIASGDKLVAYGE
jgi:outer membrane protein assembly factor BamB